MSAGQYRDYIKVLTPQFDDDGTGGQVLRAQQTDYFFAFAQVRAMSSREVANLGAVQAVGTHLIVMPFREGVTTKQRVEVVADGVTFEIVGVVDPNRKRQTLELSCVEAD